MFWTRDPGAITQLWGWLGFCFGRQWSHEARTQHIKQNSPCYRQMDLTALLFFTCKCLCGRDPTLWQISLLSSQTGILSADTKFWGGQISSGLPGRPGVRGINDKLLVSERLLERPTEGLQPQYPMGLTGSCRGLQEPRGSSAAGDWDHGEEQAGLASVETHEIWDSYYVGGSGPLLESQAWSGRKTRSTSVREIQEILSLPRMNFHVWRYMKNSWCNFSMTGAWCFQRCVFLSWKQFALLSCAWRCPECRNNHSQGARACTVGAAWKQVHGKSTEKLLHLRKFTGKSDQWKTAL